jgi:Putative phage metallopeptidase
MSSIFPFRKGRRLKTDAQGNFDRRWIVSTALCLQDRALSGRLALVRRWNERENPLPRKAIQAAPRGRSPGAELRPGLPTGARDRPFDFCGHMKRLCLDISRRSRAFAHLDVSRILIAATQARNNRTHGLQARVTPLRFRDGHLTRRRHGVTYQVQRYFIGERDILYLVTFCLPRFLDLSFDEKFVTLFHELYHIDPTFNGDLRRHDGRYSIHSHSQRRFDEQMARLARAYLSSGADPGLYAFLRLDFSQLQRRHRAVECFVVPRPKLIPVSAARHGK